MEIALLNEIKKNGQKFFKKSEDNNLNQLISRLLIKDSRERMTWEEYFDHPFFTDKKYEAFEASESSESSKKIISNISNKILIKLKI
jgi:serine/threonine protein kinase